MGNGKKRSDKAKKAGCTGENQGNDVVSQQKGKKKGPSSRKKIKM